MLWTWGLGEDGRLGHGGTDEKVRPTIVSALAGQAIRQAAVGTYTTLAVTRCGRLLSWGGGNAGSLASLGHGGEWNGDDDAVVTPQLVAALEGNPVRQVACFDEHSVVLTEAGEVYTMGEGDDGQLGHGDTAPHNVPTLVVALSPPMTKAQVNGLEVAGLAGKRALQSELTRRNLDAGGNTAALAARLLDAQPARGAVVVEVAAGVNHTLARTADGKIFSWGEGTHGALGHGDTEVQLVPKQIEAAILAVEEEEEGEEEE